MLDLEENAVKGVRRGQAGIFFPPDFVVEARYKMELKLLVQQHCYFIFEF